MESDKPAEEAESPVTPLENDRPNDMDETDLQRTKSLQNQVSLPREILAVGCICLAQLTTQIGVGGTLNIIHVIAKSFHVTNPGIESWLIAGYSLTVGTFILFSGRLGDLFGWKRMLIFGFSWFAIWNIVAGLSVYSNYVLFIFARVLGGIGPSISLPNGLALLGALYEPGMRKNLAFSAFGAAAPVGATLGIVFSGIFALAWWPWAYWSFGIALVIITVTAAWAIPDPQDHKPGFSGNTLMERIADIDLLGAFTGITGLILFNFAWNQAPIGGWASAYRENMADNHAVIVTLILGIVFFAAFIYVETKVSHKPLIPLEVLTADNAFILGCIACGWSNFGMWVYYFVQILQVLRGTSPILTAAYISPLAISGVVAAVSTGFLLSKLRPAWVMTIALCAFLAGTILVATLPPHQIYWAQIFVTILVAPFGMDMSFPSATIVISNSVDKEHQGVAASLVNTIVNYSISLGLGFAGTIEGHVNHGGKTKADILQGYRGALYMGIGLDGLGLLLALAFLLKGYREDRRRKGRASSGQDPASVEKQ